MTRRTIACAPIPMPEHPIIALWSHPRSMSTATERIMRERGDLAAFHEPFMYDYYVHRSVRQMPHFEAQEGQPESLADICAMLTAAAAERPVFFKDMSYYVVGALADERGFFASLTDVFLIRDPRRSLMSYVRLDPEVTLEEAGLEAQWRHFHWLRETTGKVPPVIEAEAIAADPQGMMGRLWTLIGLKPAPHAFAWQRESVPEDWGQVAGWHGTASASAGIRPPEDESDAEIDARFAGLAAKHPRLGAILAHHRPYYERLKAHAL
jgi:Sulfotransferase domain